MVCPLYRDCPLLRDSNCIILIGGIKFGDLVLSIVERYLIQCPLFGVSFMRDSSINVFSVIREYGSTLYVGLARAASPTNTNFRLTFLLTRLQEALYEDLAV